MKKLVIAILILIVIALPVFWFFYPLRSLLVMSAYSAQQSKESVMNKNGFAIDMPSGEGWYPFVMSYNAQGFREWSGINADMSIMYNFGAFDVWKRTSSIYDLKSDKYSSFYGAYVICEQGGVFGFSEQGILDVEEIELAVEYDYTVLVMNAFGCTEPIFEVDDYDIEEGVYFAESGGWTLVDARITASGCAHNYEGYKQPYLQYGRPMDNVQADFAAVELQSRMYTKYFEDYNSTIMIYVMAPSAEAATECDDKILMRTAIN